MRQFFAATTLYCATVTYAYACDLICSALPPAAAIIGSALNECKCQPNVFPDETAIRSAGLARMLIGNNDSDLGRAANTADEFLNGLSDQAKAEIEKSLSNPNKEIAESRKNLVKAANDIVDAAKAAGRFAERQVKGYGDTLTDAQKRFRERKVVDALWGLGVDPLRRTSDNTAKATQESVIISKATEYATGAYGGPAGAAAFAAWEAYYDSKGNADLAVKAGIQSYLLASGYADVDNLPSDSVTAVARKAAVTGAVAGIGVAASGGSNKEAMNAFLKSGGSVLVQSGEEYVEKENFDQPDQFCISVLAADCASGSRWKDKAAQLIDSQTNSTDAQSTVKFFNNHEWAISWSGEALKNAGAEVPGIVLTYVGKGSSYCDKFQTLADADNDSGIPQLSPCKEESALRKNPVAVRGNDGTIVYVAPDALRHGWIYLGKYSGGGVWVESRSDNLPGSSPEAMTGSQITLNSDVNIRSAPFACSDTGTPVISSFQSGATVAILKLSELEDCGNYVWAEVEEGEAGRLP